MNVKEGDGWVPLPQGVQSIQAFGGSIVFGYGTSSALPTEAGLVLNSNQIYVLEYDSASETPYVINISSTPAEVRGL